VGFVFPLLDLYGWGLIAIFISLIAGVYSFSLGGIYEWALLKWCGAIWWMGAVGMVFIHEDYRSLLFVPLIAVGYIGPALRLRWLYRKQRNGHAA
jgi:hypothetical protein